MSNESIHLSHEPRDRLEQLTRSGAAPARKIMHALVLLKTDKGELGPRWSDRQLQEAFGGEKARSSASDSVLCKGDRKRPWSESRNPSDRTPANWMESKKPSWCF